MSQYFSDIDLPTLHKSRKEEKVQYKLPWWNRYRHTNQQPTVTRQDIVTATDKPVNRSNHRSTCDKGGDRKYSKANNKSSNNFKHGCDNDKTKHQKDKSKSIAVVDEFDYDDGYFSSGARRRRSGTWP
jgi:hypothetical protein